MDDKISVIMGVYCREADIERSVQSIMNQTLQNLELIVCDDASEDSTFTILQEFQRKYPRKLVLLQNSKNQGLAFSLNRCLHISKGKYIARMDADDFCAPERLEIQRDFLQNHSEYSLVGTQMILVDDAGRESYSHYAENPTKDVLPLKNPFAHPTILTYRSILLQLGCYTVEEKTRRCEDLDLWYRFFSVGLKGYNLSEYCFTKKQGLENYKKRTIKQGSDVFLVNLRGLKQIHAPVWKYALAIKPIISAIIPKPIMMKYHSLKFKKKVE